METLEVAPEEWEQFCSDIQAFCQGAVASIEWVQPDGATTSITRDVPLRAILWGDKTDRCSNKLVIDSGLPGEEPIRHVVIEPIHIRLKGDAADRYNCLEVIAENGKTTMAFHPGLNSAQLRHCYWQTPTRQGSGARER
ncbi:MAG TPA: hypothetical protein VFD66_00845 [Verrucomicrobiae bacterium]|nr:hypothetical protein [Verrucomicrobiae bacterium]